MTGQKVPVLLYVLAGSFATQPQAFAALKEAADHFRLDVDMAEVDVIREAKEVRLAHYFRPQIAARILAGLGKDDTCLVLRPSPLTSHPDFPPKDGPLRPLGRFAGCVVEPSEFGF